MTKQSVRWIGSWLALVFAFTFVPKVARASDAANRPSFDSRIAAAYGPIGRVFSTGDFWLNDERAWGEHAIWGGEVVQTLGHSAVVKLDSVATLVVNPTSFVRIAKLVDEESSGSTVLFVEISGGRLAASVEPRVRAYVQVCGSIFEARTQHFHAGVTEGKADTSGMRSTSRTEGLILQPRYRGEAYEVDPLGQPLRPRSDSYRAEQSTIGRIAILVTDVITKRPVLGGLLVKFRFLTRGVADFNSDEVTVTTNSFGIAEARFTAGARRGATEIEATVEGVAAPIWRGNLRVGFVMPWKRLLVASAAAGIVVVIVWPDGRPRGPIRQVPPPTIP